MRIFENENKKIYKKMSLKTPKTVRKYQKKFQPQMSEL